MTPKITPAPMPAVVGFDPGFGNTKVCLGGQTHIVQSAVSIPRAVGLAAIGMKSAGRKTTILSVRGHDYAVGMGAAARGALKTSMDYGSLASPERRALLYAACAEALNAHKLTMLTDALLVIGLPVPLLEDKEEAQAVMESLKQLKGAHEFSIGKTIYTVGVSKIKVLAQPAGAYIDYAYDAELRTRNGVSKSEVLVIDIGMNTLDVYVLKNGQVMESFIGGAEVGVRRLLELLATNGRDVMELDADLRSGALKFDAGQLDGYLGEVLAAVKRITPNLKRFDVVIPCGGGALVLGDKLKLALTSKGAAVQWPDDPIAANVRGFYKYGLKAVG